MKIVDLTHSIGPDMPFYPGTEPPVFEKPCTLKQHGFVEHKITFYSHTGTHMDAPAHVLPQARTLDQFAAGHFAGHAIVLDLTRLKKQVIDIHDLKPYRNLVEGKEFVLLHTGWYKFWGTAAYFRDYPVLSTEAAQWLAQFDLKGVGVDMISVDAMGSLDLPIHKIFLARNMVVIENLTGLDEPGNMEFTLFCLPLKFTQADGAPVRAVAVVDENKTES